ncbi:MAG: DUF5115 domain-containing protein [Muribaculaceae bacterium]|nr:DUF5115 domain-containing protein [Muribaculaceae bacterium]
MITKKLGILLVASLSVAAWSCDEKNNVPLPTNPQEPVMTGGDLTVQSTIPTAIDLTALNASDTPVDLGKVTADTNFPEGYQLSFVGEMGREQEFVHTANFPVSLNEDGTLQTTADDLEAAFVAAVGKAPKTQTVYFRVAAYATKGNAQVRMGGLDTYYVSGTAEVTPFDLGIVIEEAYGLLGSINGWSVADAVLFNHEGDPYDNPVFTLEVTITDDQAADGWWWKVVPQSTIATGNWVDATDASFGTAVNGSGDLDGALVGRTDTEDCGAGCITAPGIYEMAIDMENRSYEFKLLHEYVAAEVLYVPGDHNGWNHAVAPQIKNTAKGVYRGFIPCKGGFKFTSQGDWGGINYGDSGTPGILSTDGGAGNLTVDTEGLYLTEVNTNELTYKMTLMNSVGLIGDFNSWSAQLPMETTDHAVYTATVAMEAGQGFKVRMNDNWDYNLGGDLNNLSEGGDNISVPETATYTVTLNLSTYPYTLTMTR